MTVVDGEEKRIPALRGGVNSVDGLLYRLSGTYYVRVLDPSVPTRCSVEMHGFELVLEFELDELK